MNLKAYLDRIDYADPCRPDLPTLIGLHRNHLLNVPYENLDIHLGQQISLDIEKIYDKIVRQGRGGWCYEMNSLFLWALRTIGFDADLVGARRWSPDDDLGVEGHHVALAVHLDTTYLADLGWGNGLSEAVPLRESMPVQEGRRYVLRRYVGQKQTDEPTWTFLNWTGDGFAFTLRPRRIEEFAAQSDEFQHAPDSPFVRTTVCHRFTPAGILTLRGLMLKTYATSGVQQWRLKSKQEYLATLSNLFGLVVDRPDELWLKVLARDGEYSKPTVQ